MTVRDVVLKVPFFAKYRSPIHHKDVFVISTSNLTVQDLDDFLKDIRGGQVKYRGNVVEVIKEHDPLEGVVPWMEI